GSAVHGLRFAPAESRASRNFETWSALQVAEPAPREGCARSRRARRIAAQYMRSGLRPYAADPGTGPPGSEPAARAVPPMAGLPNFDSVGAERGRRRPPRPRDGRAGRG